MAATATAEATGLVGFFANLKRSILALRGSPRALWMIYLVKFLESVAYFSVYTLLILYLSDDLGFSDIDAGWHAGAWLTVISLVMFFTGFVADSLGIRKAMLLSILSCLAGRLTIAVTDDKWIAMIGLYVMTWGVASIIPTMTAAVRRYTTKETVSFGFSLFYVVMNVGGLVAPLIVGTFRKVITKPIEVEALGLNFSSSQAVFAIGFLATALAFLVVWFFIPAEAPAKDAAGVVVKQKNPVAILAEVASEKTFWRFLLFVSLLVLVKLIFQHAHLTWPKYSLREFGEDFPFAFYWGINPFMIIFLTPVVTALTQRWTPFKAIVIGAIITGCAVMFMGVSTTVAASVAFIVVLSIGEAMWSPRLYEYTATIAPKGREASYMGLSQIPLFFAKPTVGFMSGWLLANYCPPEGPRDSQTMWLIVGATTLAGPLLILALHRVIEPRKAPEPSAQPVTGVGA